MTGRLNTKVWQPGDLVIHDADLKRPRMLMRVIEVIESGADAGKYRTRFAFPDKQPSSMRHVVWVNSGLSLHDPAAFGIRTSSKRTHQPETTGWTQKCLASLWHFIDALRPLAVTNRMDDPRRGNLR